MKHPKAERTKAQMPLYRGSPSLTGDPLGCLSVPRTSLHRPDAPRSPAFGYCRMFVNPQAKGSAKAFTLLGTERMAPPHSCFPSDHFGMDARFEW